MENTVCKTAAKWKTKTIQFKILFVVNVICTRDQYTKNNVYRYAM